MWWYKTEDRGKGERVLSAFQEVGSSPLSGFSPPNSTFTGRLIPYVPVHVKAENVALGISALRKWKSSYIRKTEGSNHFGRLYGGASPTTSDNNGPT